MNVSMAPRQSVWSDLLATLAKSRFLTTSLLIHLLLVLLASTWVIIRVPHAPEGGGFISEGSTSFVDGDAGAAGPEMPATDVSEPVPEMRPLTPQPPAADLVSAITSASAANAQFQLPASVTGGAPTATALPGVKSSGRPGSGDGSGRLDGLFKSQVKMFGLNADAAAVVFAVDISGSMVQGGKTEADYRRLEQEVAKAIKALDSRSRFGVIVFAGKSMQFNDALVTASDVNKTAAIKWLGQQGPYGNWEGRGDKHRGTAAGAALTQALALKPDTVFFASDGDPTDFRGQAFFDHFREAVQTHGASATRVFALSYKAGKSGQFMKELAAMTKGKFIEVD
jgi:SAM-dependent methyltransferase